MFDEPDYELPWEPPLLDLDDAATHPDDLAQIGLWARWPEPRLLDQTRLWIGPDRSTRCINFLDGDGITGVMRELRDNAAAWHRVAAVDEQCTTSSAMAWALSVLGIPSIAALHPVVWLESTALVRHLASIWGDL